MYESNGERYFIVDGHVHFWDARPENRNRFGDLLGDLGLESPKEL